MSEMGEKDLSNEKKGSELVVPSGSLVARVFVPVLPIVNACLCAF